MNSRLKWSLVFAVAAAGFLSWWTWTWKHDAPRRICLASLQRLHAALNTANPDALLDAIALPQAIQGRTHAEQIEFLTKALRDELSPDGLAELKRHGEFGPLLKLFPAEGPGWAAQAGVNPAECVAFKLDRHGQRCEVVLVRKGGDQRSEIGGQTEFRIVRCNNVKQLALAKP